MHSSPPYPRAVAAIDPESKAIKALIDIVKKHPWYASILGVVVVYTLVGFLLAPYLLQKTLVQTMQRDFDAELRVESIEINPFWLSLRINGLELDDPRGEPSARVQEFFANFQLSSLFRLALTFDEIRLTGPQLFVARDRNGAMSFAYLLQSDSAADTADTAAGEPASPPFPVLVYRFKIEGFFIDWSDRFVAEPVATRFGPIAIDINDLNTLPDRSGQQQVVIATQNSGTLSWSGELQLNPLYTEGRAQLEESSFALLSAYIRHQTGLEIVDGSADLELQYEVRTRDDGEIAARIDSSNLILTGIVIHTFADGTAIDFAGPDRQVLELPEVRLTDGRFQWPEQTLSLGSISIENPRVDLSREPDGAFNLEPRQANAPATQDASGGTQADDEDSGTENWQLAVGKFDVNGLALNFVDKTLAPEASLGLSDFNLSVSDISNQPGARFPASLDLQLTSGGKLTLRGDVAILPQPRFDLEIEADGVLLAGAEPYVKQQANVSMESGALELGGRISATAEDALSFDGDLGIANLAIAESINGKRLASWKHFHADKIAFSLDQRRLDISRLRFDGLYGDILIDENGNLNLAQVVKANAGGGADDEPAKTGDAAAAPEVPFELRIGDVRLADASTDFSDLTLPLPFAVNIDGLHGNMTTIATESSEASQVSFEGKVDEFGFARIGGFITPLQPADNTDLQVSLQNISVSKFTSYSIPFAGRKIESGKMDLNLAYRLKDGKLVGDNSVVLRDFELGEAVPHPDALDLPLGLAVALLKDASGKIDLDLQVSGDVDNPEFNIGDVIVDALGKLLTRIVLSPFAALGKLLGIEASELESIEFLPGRSDLTPPQMETATKLAEALALRPELQLVIAGVYAAEADAMALRGDRLDEALAQRISQLVAAGDAPTQFADQRRMALEQMYTERLESGSVSQPLDQLRMQYTTQAEGQAEPVFDRLAYTNALRARLIELQALDDDALAQLAAARAESLKTALLAIDASLGERVALSGNTEVTATANDAIEMKVTLSAKSN